MHDTSDDLAESLHKSFIKDAHYEALDDDLVPLKSKAFDEIIKLTNATIKDKSLLLTLDEREYPTNVIELNDYQVKLLSRFISNYKSTNNITINPDSDARILTDIVDAIYYDPCDKYEEELKNMFNYYIDNGKINEYMENVVKKIKISCQVDLLSHLLSIIDNIFTDWYVNHMIYLLKHEELSSSSRKKLINIYSLYKDRFNEISDFNSILNN